MAALASLRAPIDAFFDKVTVNDPDPAKREARLDLLARMRRRGASGRRFFADRRVRLARSHAVSADFHHTILDMIALTARGFRAGHGACAGKAGMTQYVYRFGGGVSEGAAGDKNLLGGKGANLAEMASIGLPVPPGFTISTEMCARYYAEGQAFPDSLRAEVADGLAHIEGITGKRFGDEDDPLLVSVRSGARVSMPGMMDTVLNLGLNDETVEGLAATSGDERFAWDSYRRFIQMYSDVVLELDHARLRGSAGDRQGG